MIIIGKGCIDLNPSNSSYKLKTPLALFLFSLLFIIFIIGLVAKYAWIINFYDRLELVVVFVALLFLYPLRLIWRRFFVRRLILTEEGGFLSGKLIFLWPDLKGSYFGGEHFFLHVNFLTDKKSYAFWFLEFENLEKFNHFVSSVNCFRKISFLPIKHSKKDFWFMPLFTVFFLTAFAYVQVHLNELIWPDEVILLLFFPAILFAAAMLGVWLKKIPDHKLHERITNYLQDNKHHRSIALFYGVIFSFSFFLMVLIYPLLKGPLKKNISQGPFFFYSFIFLALLLYIKRKDFILQIKSFLTLIHRAEVFSGIFVFFALFYIALSFSLGAINVKLDRGELKKTTSHLVLKKTFKYKLKIIKCFLLKDWLSDQHLSFRYCSETQEYKDGEAVEVLYGHGFLNVFWIEKIRPLWANNFDNYVQRLGGIDKLVHKDFFSFSFFNPGYDYSKLNEEFKSKCSKHELFYCRYLAYLFEVENNEIKAFDLYRSNCNQKDFLSCMNMIRIIHRTNNYKRNEEILVIEGFLSTLCASPKTLIEMKECETYKSWKKNN